MSALPLTLGLSDEELRQIPPLRLVGDTEAEPVQPIDDLDAVTANLRRRFSEVMSDKRVAALLAEASKSDIADSDLPDSMGELLTFTGWGIDQSLDRVRRAFESRKALEARRAGLQSRLSTLLEKEKPEKFNPAWIRRVDTTLYNEIYHLNCEDDLFSWYDFIAGLGEEYLLKFDFRAVTLSDLADRIALFLRREGIECWNKSLLREKNYALFSSIDAFFRTRFRPVDWRVLLAHAPDFVRNSYDQSKPDDLYAAGPEVDRAAIEKECVKKVTDFLLDAGLEEWSPQTISSENSLRQVHTKISFLYSSEEDGVILWSRFLAKLPKVLRDTFSLKKISDNAFNKHPEERELYLQSTYRRLRGEVQVYLDDLSPEEFNSGWIKDQDSPLYKRILHIKNRDKAFGWYRFVQGIEGDWLSRFYCPFKFNKEFERYLAALDEAEASENPKEALLQVDSGRIDMDLLEAYLQEKELYIENMAGVLQARLRQILEQDTPEEFSTGWIDKNHAGFRFLVSKYARSHANFCWYEFLKGVGDEWLVKFKLKCYSLKDFASKWAIMLKRDGIDSWTLDFLRQTYPSFAGQVVTHFNKHLGKNVDWQEFIDALPDDAKESYDKKGDSEELKVEKKKQREESNLLRLAETIQKYLDDEDLASQWSLDTIERQNPALAKLIIRGKGGSAKGSQRRGIAICFPHLSLEALEGFTTSHPVTAHQCLAERVKRHLGDKYPYGWNLNCIKNKRLQADLMALGKRIEVTLRFLPKDLARAFERSKGPASVEQLVHDESSDIRKLPADLSPDTAGERDKTPQEKQPDSFPDTWVENVEMILDQTGYSMGRGVSFRLFDRLLKEYRNTGNEYALLMAESILHQFFQDEADFLDYKKLPLIPFLDELRDGGDFHRQLVMSARRILTSPY